MIDIRTYNGGVRYCATANFIFLYYFHKFDSRNVNDYHLIFFYREKNSKPQQMSISHQKTR